ncbi:MAG TPA: glycoside hydrolase family 15 protein [Acidimicrobiales bacterium]|jgi:GH15 family glucan-1,4-alpha-glucosidase
MEDEPSDHGRRGGTGHPPSPGGRLVSLRPPPLGTTAAPPERRAGPGDARRVPRPPPDDPLEAIFPAIADYAFLSDCENTCLVAPTGAVEWLCLPRPHDPSVFGTLLDRSAGAFRLAPADTAVPANRRYVPGSMVLATTWQTRTGWLAVRDFLAVGPWHRTDDRSALHRRTPGDFDADHMLVRTATCLHGEVDVQLECEPSFDWGREDAEWSYTGAGYDRVRTTNADQVPLTLVGDLRLGIEGRAVRARHRLGEGESCFVVLSWSERPPPDQAHAVRERLEATNRFWRGWVDGGRFPDHPWREQLQRSALTLKGLTYSSTGALLAAPTTSLPENPGGARNWDYRFTWVRDAAFTVWALHALGFEAETADFLSFLADALGTTSHHGPSGSRRSSGTDTRQLEVLYAVDGSVPPPEIELDHLSGYGGSRPVRAGNAAVQQLQTDIFGAVVDSVYQHTRSRDALGERPWALVVSAVEAALARWAEPDHSIWEVRGEPRHFTYSKVTCWVAADRGARLAALRGDTERADRWWQAALDIHADVCARAVDGAGRFTQYYGSTELDASLLVLPLVRFLPPDDPRVRATILGVADELGEDGFVHRYRTTTTDDGLDEPEASFTVCSFWLVSALVEIGEVGRARKLCERLLGLASGLGLYGEELDPTTGRHLGNFPQALTHLALVNAVLHVISAEEQAQAPLAAATSASWWAAAGQGSAAAGSGV